MEDSEQHFLNYILYHERYIIKYPNTIKLLFCLCFYSLHRKKSETTL